MIEEQTTPNGSQSPSPSPQPPPGFIRSYSEHAAYVLQHFQRQYNYPSLDDGNIIDDDDDDDHDVDAEILKGTRSRPEIHQRRHRRGVDDVAPRPTHSVPNNIAYGDHRTWKVSASDFERDIIPTPTSKPDLNIEESCCLSADFSDLSLTERELYKNSAILEPDYSAAIVGEQQCYRLFDVDNDENGDTKRNFIDVYDGDNDRYNGCLQLAHKNFHDDDDDDYNSEQGAMESSRAPSVASTFNLGRSALLSVVNSNNSISSTSKSLRRQLSYENWAKEKKRELKERREEAKRIRDEKLLQEEKERKEREERSSKDMKCFLDWMERKNKEKLDKKKEVGKQVDFQRRLVAVESKLSFIKEDCLKKWRAEKNLMQKELEEKELLKQKKSEEEKQKKSQESLKAYEIWSEKSKSVPRPATQGLLPHQTAKPAFTNPKPWQPIIENTSDDFENEDRIKTVGPIGKIQRSRRTCIKA